MKSLLHTKVPPPVYALIIAVVMWALNKFLPLTYWDIPALRWVVMCLVIIGLTLDLMSLALFIKNRTTVNPLCPQKASQLVITGFYRLSRNPMYLGLLCLLIAWALHLASLSPLLMLPAFIWLMNEMQIKPEEAVLRAKFGQDYADYCQRVRRWI